MPPKPPVGTIAWTDLTVPDAEGIRDFYAIIRDLAGAVAALYQVAG